MKKNKKETRGRKPGKYYVSNDELVAEVKKFYTTDIFSEELGGYITKIVEGVSHMPNFINYFKEDNPWGVEMYSDAIWRITKSVCERGCKVVDDDDIGDDAMDDLGKPIYEVDKDGEYILDDDGHKINTLIAQKNIFSYFSKIAWMAFIGRIKAEKKNQEIVQLYKDKIIEEFEQEYGIIHQDENEYEHDY